MNHTEGKRAFTLVEMLLVLTLMALVTVVGLPNFRQLFERSEMQQVSSTLTATMRYAQERAVIERVPRRIVINVEKNSYYFPVEKEEERRHYDSRSRRRSTRRQESTRSRKRIREQKEIVHYLPRNYSFEFLRKLSDRHEIRRGEGEINFYPDGSVDGVYMTILRLGKSKNDESRIFFKSSPATGVIKTMEGRTQKDGSKFFEGYYDENIS